MPKTAVRRDLLAQRKALLLAERKQLSRAAQHLLLAADCFRSARTLALYSPINNEVETELLAAEAGRQRKQLCYPLVRNNTLEFRRVATADELVPGSFGIAEPTNGEPVDFHALDLIVVPGVAFDRLGHRLGYGKGFYDRELARISPATVTVGLCFSFQLRQRLPSEAHDRPMDFLVTETQFIPCHKVVAGSP